MTTMFPLFKPMLEAMRQGTTPTQEPQGILNKIGMAEGDDWLDVIREKLIKDYSQGNIVPPPETKPMLGPMDLFGPRPTRLNENKNEGGEFKVAQSPSYQIRPLQNGQYQVIDIRTGQVRFSGSLDGARNAQASLIHQSR